MIGIGVGSRSASSRRLVRAAQYTAAAASATYTNEPAGFTEHTERDFDAVGATTTVEGWWHANGSGDLDISTDATAPVSPSNVGRVLFAAGRAGGTAPATTGFNDARTYADFYLCFWLKLSANWQGHGTGTNKVFFAVRPESGGNPFFCSAEGTDSNDLEMRVRSQGTGSMPTLTANMASVVFTRDEWHKAEFLIRSNSAHGTADGEAHLWVDGTKTFEYTNCEWHPTGTTLGFQDIKWSPTWGGTGDTVIADMYQYMDRAYISVSGEVI